MDQPRTEQIVRLLSAHQEQIYRYVFALLPNEQDAKDVVQETCIALCRKFEEYDPSKPFLPWAFRFAYLEVLKQRQRNHRSTISLGDDVIELLARERDEQREMLDARLRALEACLRELPAADAELIRGRYQSQLTIDNLAAQVEMSHRTLFRNLERVRRLLFDCITRRLSAEGTS
jgi:RNA polymerase sigma-70 factor (ECF subfamily)